MTDLNCFTETIGVQAVELSVFDFRVYRMVRCLLARREAPIPRHDIVTGFANEKARVAESLAKLIGKGLLREVDGPLYGGAVWHAD